MPVAEIAAALTSLKSAADLAKALIDIRDASQVRAVAIDLQTQILSALGSAIEAREAYTAQIDRIRDLEAEVTRLKEWGSEKEKYELKTIGFGALAYMLKQGMRGTEPPHWLCPNCYTQGKKSFFQTTGAHMGHRTYYACTTCGSKVALDGAPHWID